MAGESLMPDSELDPDSVLMKQVRAGNREAFEKLVDKYKQPVVNLIARTLGDATEAEDLAQNVFIQAYKAAHRYKVSARFSTWLYTIARNLCLNELRRRSRHPAEPLEIHGAEGEPADRNLEDTASAQPPEVVLQRELETKLNEALTELPEKQRIAIILCAREEMPYEEIAKVIGCSLAATKSLIFRGREALKMKLKPYLKTGEWLADDEHGKSKR